MDADLDTLATALYVTTDDLLAAHPWRVPPRPAVGIAPRISDAEVLTLAVMQALLGFTSEARWLRHAEQHLGTLFPYLPGQSGYNKRLRKLAPTMSWLVNALASFTSVVDDDIWLVDSTPVECARSRQTTRRSDLAGWAEYGYCASHTRYFWGLRLHLVITVHGLPVAWALTGAKADERAALADILGARPAPAAVLAQHRQMLIADKKGEPPRPGRQFFKPLRQIIESVNDTLKGQLDLEQHGGRSIAGVCTRIAQRILAMTAAIWHNDHLGLRIRRSLTAYDH